MPKPKATKAIYLVIGETGEHGDREEWPVIAYLSKRRARTHARRAAKRAADIHARPDFSCVEPRAEKSEYDPNLRIDYTGTTYRVEEVPLGDKESTRDAGDFLRRGQSGR